MKDALFYRDLAKALHHDHFRRDGITPYFHHLQKTVDILHTRGERNVIAYAAAWLHDSVEDGKITFEKLEHYGAEPEVLDIVRLLTKSKDVDYFVYLHGVRENEIAKNVKIADMLANLSDTPTDEQIKKYSIGLQFLLN